MIPSTVFVRPDEKCFALLELNQMGPDGGEDHRYQCIFVNRGDIISEYRADLGPAANYGAAQFRVPCLWEHSVAEAQDIAERYRNDDYWERRVVELSQASTMKTDLLSQLEERMRVAHNMSVFGPATTRQRNGFDLKEARQWRRQ